MENNGWDEYKKLILSEMQDNKDFRKEVRESLVNLKTDVGGLKVKAAIAGGAAGLVMTGAISLILTAFRSVH